MGCLWSDSDSVTYVAVLRLSGERHRRGGHRRQRQAGHPRPGASTDYNGGHTQGYVSTRTQSSDGSWVLPPTRFGVGRGPASLVVADLNGDGRPDLVVANAPGDQAASTLTEAERQVAQEFRRQANRKLKMASLLGTGGLLEEEREALLQAVLWLGKALSAENKTAEPGSLGDVLRAPYALFWGDSLSAMRAYASNPSAPATQAATALRALVGRES